MAGSLDSLENDRLASSAQRVYPCARTTVRGREFAWGSRTYVMGIINATPDSFSGDGIARDLDEAIARARRMEAAGADWLDIGGESSRPGAEELDAAEETRRVIPCIEAVRAASSLPISVDTYHAPVAKAALAAGADGVNDIWGLRKDPQMASVVARAGAVLIAMHNQRGRELASGQQVISAIREGFRATLRICRDHGIADEHIILDPGFGFGWTPGQNLTIVRELAQLHGLGYPLLIGTSRKSTIGHVLGGAPVEERMLGTAATVALSVAAGADIVRVHDVAEMIQVVRMSDAVIGRGELGRIGRPVTIALGSNLGDRLGNLRAAVRMLEEEHVIRVSAKSAVWETAPVPADQPRYLNAVIRGDSTLAPDALLAALKRIERALGRRPERHWGPRPIDLDILFYGEERIETPALHVPHPRILERGFVLAPLAEVIAEPLPVLGIRAVEGLANAGSEGIARVSHL